MPKITVDDAITEIQRELKVRASVYPKWLRTGQIKRDVANKQYLALEKALTICQKFKELNEGNQQKIV